MKEYTFEECKEIALKFDRKIDFRMEFKECFYYASVRKWLDKLCEHMTYIEDITNKCIYVYEFPDNCAYVGLTSSIKRRNSERKKRNSDAVTKHINKTGLQPNLIQLTEYIDYELAQEMENFYFEKYRAENWTMLNIAKTGCLGGNVILWSKENCQKEALKYQTKKEFRNGSPSAYVIAKNHKWINDICQHMIQTRKDSGYWSKERCADICIKYNKFSIFVKENISCSTVVSRNGWQDELCAHMLDNKRKNNGYWNYDSCKDAISNCSSRREFSEKYQGGYTYARKHKILDELTNHLIEPIFSLTFEEAKEICKNYENRSQLHNSNAEAFRFCDKQNWLDTLLPIKDFNWSFEECFEYCKQFKDRSEFKNKRIVIYKLCKRNNWLDLVIPKQKQFTYNTPEHKEECITAIKKYTSRSEFKKYDEILYRHCIKFGWLDELLPVVQPIWDYKNCKEYCKQFTQRSVMREKNRTIYEICRDNNWLDEFLPIKHINKYK